MVDRACKQCGGPLKATQRACCSHACRDAYLGTIRRTDGCLLNDVSPARLHELYWGLDSGYPSLKKLAEQLRCGDNTLAAKFRKLGIAVRSVSEQLKIEVQQGRRGVPDMTGTKHDRMSKGYRPPWLTLSGELEKQRLTNSALTRRRRVVVPCGWCGAPVERTPAKLQAARDVHCNYDCSQRHRVHIRWHGLEGLRPRILARLQEEAAGIITEERLNRIGKEIGARPSEIDEVLFGQAVGDPP